MEFTIYVNQVVLSDKVSCNNGKDCQSTLTTNKVKIIILRYMLKSANTPMQKTNNVTC